MKGLREYLATAPAVVDFLRDVVNEYRSVCAEHGEHYHSAHEGYGVMAEEVDELWDEVKKKRKNRDPKNMRAECVQIACCALKFALTLMKDKK